MGQFFIIVFVLLFALSAIYYFWRRRTLTQLREASEYEWDFFQKNEPDFIAHLDQEQFFAVFRHTHFPRFPVYALGAFASFLISLPVTFALLLAGILGMRKLGFIPEPVDFANQYFVQGETMRIFTLAPKEAALYFVQDVSGFYYFFGILVAWLLVVGVFTHHYHKNRPGYLRDEIIRAK